MLRLTLALLLAASSLHAESLPGYLPLAVPAAHRPAPMKGALWYPAAGTAPEITIGADAVFVGTIALAAPTPAPGLHPLIVLSHGSGGNVDNLGWLAQALVAGGAIVIGVNHQGSTSRDSQPATATAIWNRTDDISALLDWALANPELAPRIDPAHITVLGFSMGGATALHLAGARQSAAAFAEYCATKGLAAPDCSFPRSGGVDFTKLPARWQADLRDPRVTATIAVDAGFSHAMRTEGITIPTLLINLGTKGAPWQAFGTGPEGSNLAARIPTAEYVEIPGAIHYTFLGECTWAAPLMLWASGEDAICSDPAGTNRAAAHHQIATAITGFLNRQTGS